MGSNPTVGRLLESVQCLGITHMQWNHTQADSSDSTVAKEVISLGSWDSVQVDCTEAAAALQTF